MTDEKRSTQVILEENKKLKSAIHELSILNEIATAIASTQSLEQIIQLIVQKCVKHLHAEQGAVLLHDLTDTTNPFHTLIRKQDTGINAKNSFHLDTQISGWMILHKTPLLINDFKKQDKIKPVEGIPDLKSILAVPLILKAKLIGVVALFNKMDEDVFTNEDQRLLSIIAGQSAQVIENARLALKEQTLIKVQEELRLAAIIQTDLLPKDIPQFGGYQLAGRSIPAKEVGGDYFDFIKIDANTFAFCVADIAGKGLPAALLMSNLQATLRGQTFIKAGCANSISFANNILYSNTDSSKFATLFYGILDVNRHSVKFCNAGHNPPFLFHGANEIRKLETGGIVVGIIPDYPFHEGDCILDLNDVLILYSDGVTEAMNGNEEEFGEEKLKEIVKNDLGCSAEEIVQRIIAAVKIHSYKTEQSDDLTIMAIKRIE